MTEPSTEEGAAEINQVLKAINEAWLAARPEDTGQYFHDDIVMVMPGFSGRVRGRDAIVESFVEFLSNATVEAFSEGDYEVDVIGGTGLATYTFRLSYSMGGKTYEGTGRDVWGFARDGGRWVAVWRFMTDLVEKEV